MATDSKKTSSSSDDLGASQVRAQFDDANDKGYFGTTPDDTPNENYTLKGVAAGKPTPETTRTES